MEISMDENGAKNLPLWQCLHDARFEGFSLSLEERNLLFVFDAAHLRRFFCLADETRFLLTCAETGQVRFGEEVPWPEKIARPAKKENAAETKPLEAKDLERMLAEAPAEVLAAALEKLAGGQWALRLGLRCSESFYPGVFVQCSEVRVAQSDGKPLSLDEFLEMGEEYWDDFADQRRFLKESMLPR